jgi:hypothetical protein
MIIAFTLIDTSSFQAIALRSKAQPVFEDVVTCAPIWNGNPSKWISP